jgi:outer membrane phospholipase A
MHYYAAKNYQMPRLLATLLQTWQVLGSFLFQRQWYCMYLNCEGQNSGGRKFNFDPEVVLQFVCF